MAFALLILLIYGVRRNNEGCLLLLDISVCGFAYSLRGKYGLKLLKW